MTGAMMRTKKEIERIAIEREWLVKNLGRELTPSEKAITDRCIMAFAMLSKPLSAFKDQTPYPKFDENHNLIP